MSTHKVCFHVEIRKIFFRYPLLSVAMIRPKIKKWVSGYPSVPNFSPPTLRFFKFFRGISLFCHIVFLITSYKNF